jgi:hypothetical protein
VDGTPLRLNYHDHFRPANDVVFSVMRGHKEIFCPLVRAVTGETIVIKPTYSYRVYHGGDGFKRG